MSAGLAVLCPGQGEQRPDMFEPLSGQAEAEAVLAEAAAVLGAHPRDLAREASPERLFENRLAQPLMCAVELATWATLSPRLPTPALFAGYSVGELAAYGCAAALSVGGILQLAQHRAALMDEASRLPSGLVAIRGLDREAVDALCAETAAEIAIINGPEHFIVGGPAPILDALARAALARGAHTVRRLPVGVASHTSRLAPASHAFLLMLEQSALADPAIPLLAGISGAPVRGRIAAVQALARQLSSTVDWHACLKTALEMDCRVFLELGPGASLTHMVREVCREAAARSVQEFRSLDGVAEWVAKQMRLA